MRGDIVLALIACIGLGVGNCGDIAGSRGIANDHAEVFRKYIYWSTVGLKKILCVSITPSCISTPLSIPVDNKRCRLGCTYQSVVNTKFNVTECRERAIGISAVRWISPVGAFI